VGAGQIVGDEPGNFLGCNGPVADVGPIQLDDGLAGGGLFERLVAGYEFKLGDLGAVAEVIHLHGVFACRRGSANALLNRIRGGCDPAGNVAALTMRQDCHAREKRPALQNLESNLHWSFLRRCQRDIVPASFHFQTSDRPSQKRTRLSNGNRLEPDCNRIEGGKRMLAGRVINKNDWPMAER
jgi:hypothetical protein